ncbi:MAG: rRNA maturation RNase YbeY, partial [Planctomycetota bacterium]
PGDVVTQIDGDVVICRDEAERQAAVRGHDARVELLLYAVHGLMHLLGEDDLDDANYQRMHEREDRLLTQMGFGPVFHGPPSTPSAPATRGDA